MLLSLLLAGGVEGKELYKWRTPDGRIWYSDVPPPELNETAHQVLGRGRISASGEGREAKIVQNLRKEFLRTLEQIYRRDLLLRKIYPDLPTLKASLAERRRQLERSLQLLDKALEVQRQSRELYISQKRFYEQRGIPIPGEIAEAVAQIERQIAEIARQKRDLLLRLDRLESDPDIQRARQLLALPSPLPRLDFPFPQATAVVPCRETCLPLWKELAKRLARLPAPPLYADEDGLLYTFDPTPARPIGFGLVHCRSGERSWLLLTLRCHLEVPPQRCSKLLQTVLEDHGLISKDGESIPESLLKPPPRVNGLERR